MGKRGAAVAFGGSPAAADDDVTVVIDWAAGHKGLSFRKKGQTIFCRTPDRIRTYSCFILSKVEARKEKESSFWRVTYEFLCEDEVVIRQLSADEAETLVEHILTLCGKL